MTKLCAIRQLMESAFRSGVKSYDFDIYRLPSPRPAKARTILLPANQQNNRLILIERKQL
jgi:hypothetical protein